MSTKIRVGAVSYLNTKPLVHDLSEIAPRVSLIYDLPSRLSDRLAAGELDVALIPSVEYFQGTNYSIVSDACIACRGPVLSVKLLSRTPLTDIRTLALDEGSRTSVALVRVLLQARFGVTPSLTALPIGMDARETSTDAVLLIGDRAIHPPHGDFVAQWDLGEEWCRWSGLPFVFAMWTARSEVDTGDLDVALSLARDAGVERLAKIAAAEAAKVGLSCEECLSYLADNLYFYLGERERRGLELFRNRAAGLNLISTPTR